MSEKQQVEAAPQFLGLLKSFEDYVNVLLTTTVPTIEDPEDRDVAEALSQTARHITANFSLEAAEMYAQLDGDTQNRFNNATRQLGGNELISNFMTAAKKYPAKRRGFWSKFYEIIEAIKKIIIDIMNVSLFGISLNDIIGVAFKIEEIFHVLDNIIQTIAKFFGGDKLRQQMYEAETRNIDMEMKLIRLKQLKYSPQ